MKSKTIYGFLYGFHLYNIIILYTYYNAIYVKFTRVVVVIDVLFRFIMTAREFAPHIVIVRQRFRWKLRKP